MPNWKKVIVSGSNAVVNNITGSGHLNILNNGFTVNTHASTELEVAGDISASNGGNISGRNVTGSNNMYIGNNATIQSDLHVLDRLSIGTTNGASAQLTIASSLSDSLENGILMYRAIQGGVTASTVLGAIGFDSTGSSNPNFSSFSTLPNNLLKASAYMGAVAAEFQDEDNKGGHLVFGTKPIDSNEQQLASERMRITAAGNIGIGTVTANHKLHLSGSNPQICIEESNTEFIRIGVEATTGDMCIGWDDSDDLHLGCFNSPTDSSIATKMLIKSTGRVGIGETIPDHMLHIKGDSSDTNTQNPQICIEESSTEFVRLGVEASSGDMCLGWDDSDDLHLGCFSSTTDTTIATKMLIRSDGHVGIGTTSPTSLFHVSENNAGTNLPVARVVSSGAGSAEGLRITFSGLSTPGTAAEFLSFCRQSDVEIDTIEGDGAGGARFTGDADGTYSDIRNKDNIVTLTDTSSSLGIVKGLDVLEYTLKTDTQEIPTRRVGFSAQQLLEVYPHPVTTYDEKNERHNLEPGDDGFWYHKVAEGRLTPLLVQAIKELTSKIESLETRIQELES